MRRPWPRDGGGAAPAAAALRIGPVALDSPFLLAPLAGVSDSPFRRLAREQGAAAVYTEMVSADGLARGHRATLELCRFAERERPLGIQLFGSEPGVMAEATRRLCDLPAAERPDVIDINMGCPVRKVVNRSAGAALLNDLPRIAEIVRGMAGASTVPVTAKIRLGWDGRSRNVVEVARTLEQSGAAAVAIHARTRAEKFEGHAHWEMIGAARRAIGIPVIGNGDVRTAEDALRMLETTGCHAVMVGRAAFGDPWVFRRLRAFHERGECLPLPTAAERLATGIRHLELLVADLGEAVAAREMRKHAAWYVRGLPHSARVREQVNRAAGAAEVAELLRGYLGALEREGLLALAPEPAGAAPEALRAAG
jgi:nifR3 family TIM-barrel protein